LLRADGSGPLAGVPLTHDRITAPLKPPRCWSGPAWWSWYPAWAGYPGRRL